MGIALMITSGKGGVGKSTIAANLAVALARLRYNVALVDANTGMRGLDLLLGLQNDVVYDLNDLAEGLCRVRQALLPVPGVPGLTLLSASQMARPDQLSADALRGVLDRIKYNHRYVIVDGPPGIDTGFFTTLAACEKVIIVTRPETAAERCAERMAQVLSEEGRRDGMLIVNEALPETPDEEGDWPHQALARRLGVKPIGLVPYSDDLAAMTRTGRAPAAPDGSMTRLFEDIARRAIGEDLRLRPYAAR